MKSVSLAIALGSVLLASAPVQATVSNVFVSNGDNTMSLVRCVTSSGRNPIRCEERERMDVGFRGDWPANQYRGHPAWWWTGISGEVVGLKALATLKSLEDPENVVRVRTYNEPGRPAGGANFIGISPDGRTAWNSAREVDRIQEIDTDPDSPTFGTILTELVVPDLDPTTGPTATLGATRPCDATITPDGRYYLSPDLAGETLTIVDTWSKQIIHQVMAERAFPDERILPFMATTDGNIVLVENLEGPNTYDIWDVSVLPHEPIYLKKLTQADGLGVGAQTSEFTRDGRFAYLIMNGVANAAIGSPNASRLDVLDVDRYSSTYLQIVGRVDLPFNCRAHAGDFSNDGSYFFVNCSGSDELAVVDSQTNQLVTTVAVGTGPRGVIVR
jgi:YVTN family beta-propeller protein